MRLGLFVLLVAGLAAPSVAAAADVLPQPAAGSIHWRSCGKGSPRGLQCGALLVPRDYAAPGGEKLRIALNRSAATTKKRLGSLLLNPGGPGGSGLDLLAGVVRDSAYRRLNRRYDLIGFDPRGVGKSTTAQCEPGASEDLFASDDEEALTVAKVVDELGPYILGCQEASPGILPYLGTVDVARDMEQIRVAVGDEKLNYLGYSYGGHLGATYVSLFPQSTGRIVLDGVDDPDEYINHPLLSDLHQAQANEQQLMRFLAFVQREAHPKHGGAVKGYRAAIKRLERKPAKVRGVRGIAELHADDVRYVMAEFIAVKSVWPYLAVGVKDLIAGHWRTMAGFAGLLDPGQEAEDTSAGYFGNAGADRVLTVDAVTEAYVAKSRSISPDFPNDSWMATLATAMWPHPAAQFTGPWAYDAPDGSPPVLVIGTRYDPRTPYAGAPALTERLGHATLLTLEGDGHTAFDNSENGGCIDAKVVIYFLRGQAPKDGTRCRQAAQRIARTE